MPELPPHLRPARYARVEDLPTDPTGEFVVIESGPPPDSFDRLADGLASAWRGLGRSTRGVIADRVFSVGDLWLGLFVVAALVSDSGKRWAVLPIVAAWILVRDLEARTRKRRGRSATGLDGPRYWGRDLSDRPLRGRR